MLRSAIILLAVGAALVHSKKCVDGKDNVIKIYDTTNGKGKILVKDFEIGTYDEHKKPICLNGKPQFTFPGHFKVLKGTVEVVEPVNDGADSLKLNVNLEKNSFMIGVVCQNGESKNQFVPKELCSYDLCKITSFCGLLSVKTPAPLELAPLVGKEFIDMGAMPIPQLAGEWKLSVKLVQGGKTVGGLRVGKPSEWLSIESHEAGHHKEHEEDEEEHVPEEHDDETPEDHEEL